MSMRWRSQHDLVRACRGGEEAAWDELLERYSRLIWSVAQRFGLREGEAREIFQRTWLAILEGIDDLKHPERLAGWIMGISRNQVYLMFSERQRRRREVALADLGPEGSFEPVAEDEIEAELERIELGVMMREALQAIDGRCRCLLEMLFLHDPAPDYRQISELLGIAVGSIGPTSARCLKKLEKKLAGMYHRGS
jgi:RNA polymerase sigma factor (sigma-70 family)